MNWVEQTLDDGCRGANEADRTMLSAVRDTITEEYDMDVEKAV